LHLRLAAVPARSSGEGEFVDHGGSACPAGSEGRRPSVAFDMAV